MVDKPVDFPISVSQRIRNRHGMDSIDCIVTERWLKFHSVGAPMVVGTPFTMDVMTDATEYGDARKICELVITMEDLERVLASIKKSSAVNC